MKILSLANFKGGIGKTTTARTLGDILSKDYRVLMVDLDPQASLTLSCGKAGITPNLVNVFSMTNRMNIDKVIQPISENLYLAPGALDLAITELELISRMGREQLLLQALQTVKKLFDIVLCDCPPSLSLLTINALAASNAVLIPVKPEPLDVAALRLFLGSIDDVREQLNPKLDILGILPTFYDDRLNIHKDGIAAMTAAKWPVLPYKITRSVRVSEAPALGESIITFEPGNKVAGQYKELAGGIEKWLKS